MTVRTSLRRRAGGASALLAAGALALHGVAASAATANTSFTWSGGGTDALWSDAGNWVNASIPIDNGNGWVMFPQLSSGLISNQNLDAPFFLQNITFTGSGYGVAGSAIRLGGSLTDSGGGAGMNTIANNIVLPGAVSVAAANLKLSGTITSANGVMNAALNVGTSNTLLTLAGTGSDFNNLQVGGGSVVLDGGSLALTSTSSGSSTDAVAVGLGTKTSATFTVQDGATLDTSAASDVGIEATASGLAQMTITGATTLWKLPSTTNIGEGGSGSLTVSNGATVSGGALSFFLVGDGGAGSLTIGGGGNISDTISEINTGSTAQISGAGSIWTSSAALLIGGTGQLSVQSGGAASIASLIYSNTSGVNMNVMGGAVTAGSLASSGTVGSISLSDPAAGIALTINGASGTNTFSGAIGGTGSLLKTGASTQVLAGVNTYGGTTTITGGALVIAAAGAIPNGTTVSISNGGALDLANHGTGPKIVAQLAGLTIAGSAPAWKGVVDLSNNDLIVDSGENGESVAATIASQVASGRGTNGAWTGTGITSSAAAASPSTMALAVVLNDTNQTGSLSGTPLVGTAPFNNGLATFDGRSVADGDVLVKFTYYGDALLDGNVIAADYIQIDDGFESHLTGWYNGDFNYDGVINGDDYTLIDNAFNSQGITGVSSPVSAPTEIIAAVPEPASLAPLMAAAVGFIVRRRKVGGG
jgi:autotransporter-associated beta strand protein/T5SS/PEP-CTERM-associated repeat protein